MPRPAPTEHKVRVNVTMTPKLYKEVQELAKVNLRPFSNQVELLIRRGMA